MLPGEYYTTPFALRAPMRHRDGFVLDHKNLSPSKKPVAFVEWIKCVGNFLRGSRHVFSIVQLGYWQVRVRHSVVSPWVAKNSCCTPPPLLLRWRVLDLEARQVAVWKLSAADLVGSARYRQISGPRRIAGHARQFITQNCRAPTVPYVRFREALRRSLPSHRPAV
jgi:hypothetical protein